MTLHIQATTGCNLGCTYCYENPDRSRSEQWANRQYDMDEIMETLKEFDEQYQEVPGLHGGEPLLMKKEDLETIMEYVYEEHGRGPGIQTNGTLIDEEHIELFKKYDCRLGISCDGPEELNRERKAAGERDSDQTGATDKATQQTHEAIERAIEEDVNIGIITVLNTQNAGTDERLERLLEWMDRLTKNGLRGHFNPAIPYEDIQTDVSLSPDRLTEVYLQCWDWYKEEEYRVWGPFDGMIDNLIGNGNKGCVNRRCDVFNSRDAKSIKGNGESTGCGKTWEAVGDGVPFLQGPKTDNEFEHSDERYEVLKNTPGPHAEGEPDMGGCKGCKFWNICQGGCPSAGLNDDWRNRSIFCKPKYTLYEKIAEDIYGIFGNAWLMDKNPWDAKLTRSDRKEINFNGDFQPFGSMRPGTRGPSSATRRNASPNPEMDPEERLPNRALPERLQEKNHRRQQGRKGAATDGGTDDQEEETSSGWKKK